jgi:hypothetical protein
MVYPVPTNEAMTMESQRYNCLIRNGGNTIPKHACPEAKDSKPATGLTLLWAHNPFRGISITGKSHKKKKKTLHPKRQKEPRKTTEETSGCVRLEQVNNWPNSLIAT